MKNEENKMKLGTCMGGLDAIDFFWNLFEELPEEKKDPRFCEKYDRAMNRIRYECYKGIGVQKKINKAAKAWHHDFYTCGHCGAAAGSANYNYCPNCGTRYLTNPVTIAKIEERQLSLEELMDMGEAVNG